MKYIIDFTWSSLKDFFISFTKHGRPTTVEMSPLVAMQFLMISETTPIKLSVFDVPIVQNPEIIGTRFIYGVAE